MYLWIGRNCNPNFLTQVLGVPNYAAVPDNLVWNLLQESHLFNIVTTCCFLTHPLHPQTWICVPLFSNKLSCEWHNSHSTVSVLPGDGNVILALSSHSICCQSWTLPSHREPELSLVGWGIRGRSSPPCKSSGGQQTISCLKELRIK